MIFGYLVVFHVARKYIDTASALLHLLGEFLPANDINMLNYVSSIDILFY